MGQDIQIIVQYLQLCFKKQYAFFFRKFPIPLSWNYSQRQYTARVNLDPSEKSTEALKDDDFERHGNSTCPSVEAGFPQRELVRF